MSDFRDPLNDPAFPDRPQHPDFWKLSEIILQLDGMKESSGATVADEISKEVDRDSFLYMLQNRSMMAAELFGLPPEASLTLAAVWMEGFIVGSRFSKRKQ